MNESTSPLDAQMSRRGLMRFAMAASAAIAAGRMAFRGEPVYADPAPAAPAVTGPFTLPPLPYSYNALKAVIDERTMHLHHDKHHQAYVDKLNAAVAKAPSLAGRSATDLVTNLGSVPDEVREAVRNNAGGHVNHTLFWEWMSPKGGGAPTGAIGDAIKGTFGSFETFSTQFNEAGAGRFGSGWVWLVSDAGKLKIVTTQNQDNPLSQGMYPLLGNDVWEHAYYLKYENRRPEYLKAWWKVVNWDAVNARMADLAKMQLKV